MQFNEDIFHNLYLTKLDHGLGIVKQDQYTVYLLLFISSLSVHCTVLITAAFCIKHVMLELICLLVFACHGTF